MGCSWSLPGSVEAFLGLPCPHWGVVTGVAVPGDTGSPQGDTLGQSFMEKPQIPRNSQGFGGFSGTSGFSFVVPVDSPRWCRAHGVLQPLSHGYWDIGVLGIRMLGFWEFRILGY